MDEHPEQKPGAERSWSAAEASYVDDDEAFRHLRSERHRRPPRRRRAARLGLVLIAVTALLAGVGTGYARGYFSNGRPGGEVTVHVPSGATLDTIAQALEDKGVVKHARAFVIRVESDGYGEKLMPGTYTLHRNEPYELLIRALLHGAKPVTVKAVIPEGTTITGAAAIVSGNVPGVTAADYVHVARKDPPPFHLKGYRPGTMLEGLLFPATYEVDPKITARAFIEKQLAAFDAYFAKVDTSRAAKANLTPYDVVIIASMIDREVHVPAERPLVAAVIWNRLRKHMLLQIDATVLYALGTTKPGLTFDDLKVDSPYNTYKYPGLPPTPISNPGLAALEAAADPAAVPYLYYVARNDGTDRHYFTASYAQFLVDKAKAAANSQ